MSDYPQAGNRLCSLIFGVLLSLACAHPYQLPDVYIASPLASLTQTASHSKETYVTKTAFYGGLRSEVFLVEEGCPLRPGVFPYGGAATPLGDVDYKTEERDPTISIPANKLIFIRTTSRVTTHKMAGLYQVSCTLTIGFIPDEGRRYILHFRKGTGECAVDIRDESQVRVPTTNGHDCEDYRAGWSKRSERLKDNPVPTTPSEDRDASVPFM